MELNTESNAEPTAGSNKALNEVSNKMSNEASYQMIISNLNNIVIHRPFTDQESKILFDTLHKVIDDKKSIITTHVDSARC